jgi:hypothetical protein
MLNALRDFLKLEAASGSLLVGAAFVAMLVANSPLSGLYDALIALPVEIRVRPVRRAGTVRDRRSARAPGIGRGGRVRRPPDRRRGTNHPRHGAPA